MAEPRTVEATFDGEPLSAPVGSSVAAALIGSGRPAWRTTRDGERRGVFCGIGVCFDCLVEIDGESGQRACMIPLREGMEVRAASGPSRGAHNGAEVVE
ncbi:(2Fe-2S)-binding protein [Leucobacter sp. USHLN153]|uniref:(2Fe-2S)-binding protein n=1 Tax=Leucobacter sp. USHLN153 TaxID=3081268 RepID=UPI003015DBA9